jgi:hypothetical protein
MKMRILSVEVRHEGDGSESTGSDTVDSTLLGQSHNSFQMGSPSTQKQQEQYENTMGSLAAAMTELHTELRDRTKECEALYETAHNLSHALQESDRLLQEKTLECERLLLKLQMVTFVDCSDEPDDSLSFLEESFYDQKETEEDYTIPERPAAILDHIATKYGGKKVLTRPKPETFKRRSKGVNPHAEAMAQRRGTSSPVCVDDTSDDDTASTSSSSSSESSEAHLPLLALPADPNTVRSATTRQAHFYHVITERDMALQTNKKMARELKYNRTKIRELKAKLEKTTALVELSYESSSESREKPVDQSPVKKRKPQQEPQQLVSKEKAYSLQQLKPKEALRPRPVKVSPPKQLSPRLSASSLDEEGAEKMATLRRRNIPWLRKNGVSVRQSVSDTETVATFISEDEMISSHWNKTDHKLVVAALEENYLRALSSDDADRAGGGGGVSPAETLTDI